MKIRRLIPNLLTAGNLVGGILAIISALTGSLEAAPLFIFISAIFDFLDGFAARLLKVQSEMGKQLDSLADMVTFGVAPGIIMFVYLNQSIAITWRGEYRLMTAIAFLIPVCALFRLAKFNLDERQSDSFIGLPTPAMTIFFASLPLLVPVNDQALYSLNPNWAQTIILDPIFIISSIIVLSFLMVSELPLFSLKLKHLKIKGNEIRYIFLTISIILLATLFVWALPIIILLYIILSVINNLTKKESKDEIQS
jgi:CDP-diacylglycerol---serine O-phosphatidyltransferase